MARRLEGSVDYNSENWQDVIASAEMGALACVAFLMVFEAGSRLVYWPKRRYRPHRTPRAMPGGAFAWAGAAAMGDEELCALVGLDAFLMLRYLQISPIEHPAGCAPKQRDDQVPAAVHAPHGLLRVLGPRRAVPALLHGHARGADARLLPLHALERRRRLAAAVGAGHAHVPRARPR